MKLDRACPVRGYSVIQRLYRSAYDYLACSSVGVAADVEAGARGLADADAAEIVETLFEGNVEYLRGVDAGVGVVGAGACEADGLDGRGDAAAGGVVLELSGR